MTAIKKAAYDAVLHKLQNEMASLNGKIGRNKYEFKKLVDEQTRLKRERAVLWELTRSLRDKGAKSRHE